MTVGRNQDAADFLKLASRYTSDSLLDDLRACNFCFSIRNRNKCASMVRAVHIKKAGLNTDVRAVAKRVIMLLSENNKKEDSLNCLLMRGESQTVTPRPSNPSDNTESFNIELGLYKNAKIFEHFLEEEFNSENVDSTIVGYDVDVKIPGKYNGTSRASIDDPRRRVSVTKKKRIQVQKKGMFSPFRNRNSNPECGSATCTAIVHVKGKGSEIDKDAIAKAINRIKKVEPGFEKVFNPDNSDVIPIGNNRFMVTIPFRRNSSYD